MCRDEQAVEFIFDRWGHANLISVRCAVRFLLVHFIFGSEHIYLRNTRVPAVLLHNLDLGNGNRIKIMLLVQ
jgi:hypothetical protein